MDRTPNRNRLVFVFCAGLILTARSLAQGQPPDFGEQVQARIEPSVVYLQFWKLGETSSGGKTVDVDPATGFVFIDPLNRRWILTTAHALILDPSKHQTLARVKYRLWKQGHEYDCPSVIVDAKHDLAALSPDPRQPLNVPALQLSPDDPPIRTARLYAVGSPVALDVRIKSGVQTNAPITVRRMAEMRALDMHDFRPFADDLTLLQHDILVAPGFSGAPVVNDDAKVVGVQSTTIKGTSFVGFAVHPKHIRAFDWNAKPVALPSLDLSVSNLNQALEWTVAHSLPFDAEQQTPAKAATPPPLRLKAGGIELEAPMVHHGYVERDAQAVLNKYVQDKEWYADRELGRVRLIRLQKLLDRTRLARISNPVLGFQLLVPKGYRYSAVPIGDGGLACTFEPPEARAKPKPYDNPLAVYALVKPGLYWSARQEFKKGPFAFIEPETANFELFASVRDQMVNKTVNEALEKQFTGNDLGLRVKAGPNTFYGNPKAETYGRHAIWTGVWHRVSYCSLESSLCHQIRCANREPVVILAHFRLTKEDATAFASVDGGPNPTLEEYGIMASTITVKP